MRIAFRPRLPQFRRALAASTLALACASGAAAARAEDKAPERPAPVEEARPPRPPLPPARPPVRLPWARNVELGADVALVFRPASVGADDAQASIRYEPALGFGAHARWEIFRYLRFNAYFLGASHALRIPEGALGIPGKVESASVDTFSFGARLAPTLPLGDRARAWVSVGIGYGRFEFPKMYLAELGPYPVRERAMSFAEVPAGIGISYDLIRDWLTLELEVLGALALGQDGTSTQRAQAIDAEGRRRSIGGLPVIDATFVQTLGLSIVL